MLRVLTLALAVLLLLGGTAQAVPAPLPSGLDVDYQLGGPADPAAGVGIVVRDRTEAPAPGLYNICYVNAF